MGVPGGYGGAYFRLAHGDQAVHGGQDAGIVMERRGGVGFGFSLFDRRLQGRHRGLVAATSLSATRSWALVVSKAALEI